MKRPKTEAEVQELVLKMLNDLRASNRVFGMFGHKKNMDKVIRHCAHLVRSGVYWEQ